MDIVLWFKLKKIKYVTLANPQAFNLRPHRVDVYIYLLILLSEQDATQGQFYAEFNRFE